MRSELERISEIEDYLLGKLNDADRQSFEQRIEADITLSHKVEFQKIVTNRVMVYAARQAVIEAGKRFNSKDRRFFGRSWLSFLIVLFLLIGSFVFFYNKDSDHISKKEPIDFNPRTEKSINHFITVDSSKTVLVDNLTESDGSVKPRPNVSSKIETKAKVVVTDTLIQKPKAKKVSKPVAIDMVRIEGGSFDINNDFSIEMESYELSKYEVTQVQWRTVMGTNPSYFQGCDQCPVEQVSWDNIQVFIKKLNKRNHSNYRLPKHTESAFAIRGGVKRSGFMYYKDKADIRKIAWCSENSGRKTHEVGLKLPNELGIYDLHGNVWEWVADVWPDDYDENIKSTHRRAKDKSDKMLLGGSAMVSSKDFYMVWYLPEFTEPSDSSSNLGFRLARSVDQ